MFFVILIISLIALLAITGLFISLLRNGNNDNNIQFEQRLKILQEQNTLLQTHLTEHLMKSFDILRGQIAETLKRNAEQTDKQVNKLTEQIDNRLKEISGQVEKRLSDGFEKTTATFQDVVKRLALIDEAQKKITELSSNVVSLQQVLADKRSRGAFGEVQLSALVSELLPEKTYAFQHTFTNGNRVDCILFLPAPTGNICIDAKFPLESYQRMMDNQSTEHERSLAANQFKKDIKKHIHDIANKYIIANETSDGAIMFIPAEAIFAEIHGHYPELVQEAQRAKVWLTSPTTLMAVLTTVRAVLKDDATRKQIHIIQEHLAELNKDFNRFQERMDKLSKHIELAHKNANEVHTSAKKIHSRFQKIEQVELQNQES